MPDVHDDRFEQSELPLGRWLLARTQDEGPIGDLARAAKADTRFPKDGDFEAISRRLNELQAEGEMHVVLEDAEASWLRS